MKKNYSYRTLQALKSSIKKWEGIVAGKVTDKGAQNCALCKRFYDGCERCERENGERCPVRIKTTINSCLGSPWQDWAWHGRIAHANYPSLSGFKVEKDCPECLKLAKVELRFLKNLLPRERKEKRP